jgi:transcriptional regulator with AAA-type ATPase domain
MERAVTLADADVIELEDLPLAVCGDYAAALGPSLRRNDSLRAWASRYARLVLDRCDGNKREACRTLDISYHTLQSYLRFPVLGSAEAGSRDGTTGAPEAWPDEADPSGPVEVESAV